MQVPLPRRGVESPAREREEEEEKKEEEEAGASSSPASIQERRMRGRAVLLGRRGSFSLTAGKATHEVGMQLQG